MRTAFLTAFFLAFLLLQPSTPLAAKNEIAESLGQELQVGCYLNYTLIPPKEGFSIPIRIIAENTTHWFITGLFLSNEVVVSKTSFDPIYTAFYEHDSSEKWEFWINPANLTIGTPLNFWNNNFYIDVKTTVTVPAGTFTAWKAYNIWSHNSLFFETTIGILVKYIDENNKGMVLAEAQMIPEISRSKAISGYGGTLLLLGFLGTTLMIIYRRKNRKVSVSLEKSYWQQWINR